MDDMNDLGALIKRERERQGYTTQVAFARALGKTQNWLSRLESGSIKELPTPEDLRCISETLDLPMRTMLEVAGYLDPEPEQPNTVTIRMDSELADLVRLLKRSSPEAITTVRNIVRLMHGESLGQRRPGVLPHEGTGESGTYSLG